MTNDRFKSDVFYWSNKLEEETARLTQYNLNHASNQEWNALTYEDRFALGELFTDIRVTSELLADAIAREKLAQTDTGRKPFWKKFRK